MFEGEPRFVICILHGTFKCDGLREGSSLGTYVTTDSGVGSWLRPFAFEVKVLRFQMVFTQGGRGFLIATPSAPALSLATRQPSQISSEIPEGAGAPVPAPLLKDVIRVVPGQGSDLGKGHLVTKQEWALVCQLATPSLPGRLAWEPPRPRGDLGGLQASLPWREKQ